MRQVMNARMAAYRPRRRPGKVLPLMAFLALVLASLPVGAQSGGTSTKATQAVLHIRVRVVPVVAAPASSDTKASPSSVEYTIPTSSPQMDLIKETHPLRLGRAGISGDRIPPDALLETVTLVPR